MVSMHALITDREFTNLTSVFNSRYLGIVSRLLIRYEASRAGIVTLFPCRQWLCSPSNDINVSISEYFENPDNFGLFRDVVSPPNHSIETLMYVFRLSDRSEISPIPEDLNDLYFKTVAMEIDEPEPEPRTRMSKRLRK